MCSNRRRLCKAKVVARRPKSARVEKVKDDDPEETRQMFDKRELRKPLEQWKKGPVLLFRVYVRDEKLPSYVGIIIKHYEDPYLTTSIMESCESYFWLKALCIWMDQILWQKCDWWTTSCTIFALCKPPCWSCWTGSCSKKMTQDEWILYRNFTIFGYIIFNHPFFPQNTRLTRLCPPFFGAQASQGSLRTACLSVATEVDSDDRFSKFWGGCPVPGSSLRTEKTTLRLWKGSRTLFFFFRWMICDENWWLKMDSVAGEVVIPLTLVFFYRDRYYPPKV